MKNVIILILALCLLACGQQQPEKKQVLKEVLIPNQEAKGFEVYRGKDYVKIKVSFDNQEQVYVLVNKEKEIPKNINYDLLVRTPVESCVTLSSTHIALLEKINELSSIKGIDNPLYTQNQVIKEACENGTIKKVGEATQLNKELLYALQPEFVMVSPMQMNLKQYIEEGLPMVANAEYLEKTPLGRAEWLKFVAYFYEKEQLANQVFDEIYQAYQVEQKRAKNSNQTVFSGKIYQNTWYVSGGGSYVATLLKDAQLNYMLEKDTSVSALPLAKESVFSQAQDIDYWFVQLYGEQASYESLLQENELYAQLKSVKNKQIFAVNTSQVDYYGRGVVEPHLLLQDLNNILQEKNDKENKYIFLLR